MPDTETLDFALSGINPDLQLPLNSGKLTHHPDAIAQYKEALRLKPDFAPGWHNLGVSWFRLGNLPAAVAAFGRNYVSRPMIPRPSRRWPRRSGQPKPIKKTGRLSHGWSQAA